MYQKKRNVKAKFPFKIKNWKNTVKSQYDQIWNIDTNVYESTWRAKVMITANSD